MKTASPIARGTPSPTTASTPLLHARRHDQLAELRKSQPTFADAAKQNQLAAMVYGASGVAMLGVGVVLYLTAPSNSDPSSSGSFRVLPDVAPGRAGFTLGATF